MDYQAKTLILASSSLLLAFLMPAHAVLGWRDNIRSLWPNKPVEIDGRATEWSELPVVEVGGLSFRAMNDDSSLDLLIRGANDDGRSLLSGKYRQNVTLWFLKPDHKTKSWGITLDFKQAHHPEYAPEDPRGHTREITSLSDIGITPEMVRPEGLEVSTAAFPTDFAFQADLSTEYARQPIYEMRIPLSMIPHEGRSIYFDLTSSEVSAEIKADLQGHRSPARSGGSGTENGGNEGGGRGSSPGGGGRGGRHGRGMGGGGGSGGSPAMELPKPLHLNLTVSLARAPKS